MSKKLFGNFFSLRRSRSRSDVDGSSRRGCRYAPGEETSVRTLDSSNHSALFDLELSHRGTQVAEMESILARMKAEEEASRDPSVHFPGGLLQRVVYLGRPLMEFELDLLQDVKSIRESCSGGAGLIMARLAEELAYMGYLVEVRTNNPTDPAYRHHNIDKTCLEKLRHSYLVCYGTRDGSVQHCCVIDPRFRDQFQVGHPTTAYTSLLKAVPVEFVGSPLRLQALVSLLCGEISSAYASQELPLPPWRKVNAVLSKWFTPADMAAGAALAPPGCGPAAAAALPLAAAWPGPGPGPGALQAVQQQQQQHEEEDTGHVAMDLPITPTWAQPSPTSPAAAPIAATGNGSSYGSRGPSPSGAAQPSMAQPSATTLVQAAAARGGGGAALPGLGAAGLPPGEPPLGGPGSARRVGGMHFFEALSLHQASLQRQRQEQAAAQATAAAAQQAQHFAAQLPPGEPLQPQPPVRQRTPPQHAGGGLVGSHRSLAQQAQQAQQTAVQQQLLQAQLQQQQLLQASQQAQQGDDPMPPLHGSSRTGAQRDSRVHDRTNRPRRRHREAQFQQHQVAAAAAIAGAAAQVEAMAAAAAAAGGGPPGSLWVPLDEGIPMRRLGPDAVATTRGPTNASSWTDLSTILETRSAQSSPQGGGGSFAGSVQGAGGAAGAAAPFGGGGAATGMTVSRASSESARTATSSRAGGAGAGAPSSMRATPFPSMPVAAFAGEAAASSPAAAGGGPLALAGLEAGRSCGGGSSGGGGKKSGKRVVSLLAKGLKSMSQKQTWANLLPNVSTVKRQGSSREGSSRGGGDRSWRGAFGGGGGAGGGGDRSWRGGDRSTDGSKHGRRSGGQQQPPVAPRNPLH